MLCDANRGANDNERRTTRPCTERPCVRNVRTHGSRRVFGERERKREGWTRGEGTQPL